MIHLPSTEEEMRKLLEELSDEELQEVYEMQIELESRLSIDGPQTDDELHAFIKDELDIDIPRVAVCEDHDAPFDFVADVFFERVNAVLVMGSRGSGKTFLVAVIHWCNSKFKPGVESCVVADTLIDCPRDHRRYPGGIAISQIQPGQLVWTFNEETRRFELKPVVEARMTRKNAPVFKLTLDDGNVIRSTADHRFMRRDGSWAELRDLRPGDSLMPMYRDWEPYIRVRPDASRGGGMVKEYDAVANVLWPDRKGLHVDHVDERRENSDPENLQLLTPSDHCYKTMKGRKFGFRERGPMSENQKRLISASLVAAQADRVITDQQRQAYVAGGKSNSGKSKPLIEHVCECGKSYHRPAGGRPGVCPDCNTESRTCPVCFESYVVPRKSRRQTCSRSCGQKMRHAKEAGVWNHQIVSIEPDGSEDVWDMEVADNHNFVVHGVVLHNCTFGAIESQSFRAYAHLKKWIYDENGERRPEVVSSLMRETIFKNNSKIEVLGSTPECHPPDELVLTIDGYKRIDELDPNVDKLASYSSRKNYLTWGSLLGRRGKNEIAHPFQVGVRQYEGPLLTFRTSSGDTRVTPTHTLRIKFKKEFRDSWVIYLMRQGDWWRIGKTKGRTLSRRGGEERCDQIWILDVVEAEPEACERESVYQARYGITGVCFVPYNHSNARINDPAVIHSALEDESTARAEALLEDLGMSVEVPFMTRTPGGIGRFMTNGWFDITAGNAARLNDTFLMPVVEEDFENGGRSECRPLESEVITTISEYSGEVYSLEVLPLHYYVANGVVVHNSVNGPHPHKVHADEIELMREDTWAESRNMSTAGRTSDGKLIIPQDILTSTRKGPSGRMQMLIDEIDEAVREGYEPPRKLYSFCLFEAAAERPDCQRADPIEREARLNELGLDPCSLCNCDKIRKGSWDDGTPRTLDTVCEGKFFRSRGHEDPSEVKKHFRENDRNTFEVQQLCLMPEMKFHYFPSFKEAHHTIRNFIPDPENGYIFQSVDWGGKNAHSVHWYQLMTVEVEVTGWTRLADGTYPKVRLREGTIICFDEIYVAEIGNEKLGKLVLAREAEWRRRVPGFRVRERFADPQGKAARIDWRDMGLITKWHTTREFEEHIKVLNDLVDDDLIRVDARCEDWIREVKNWRRDEKTGAQIDVDNHAMSDFRYAISNIKRLSKSLARSRSVPSSSAQKRSTARVRVIRQENSGPVGYREPDEFANWRSSLGEPISYRNS